jgi:hypothetical protein
MLGDFRRQLEAHHALVVRLVPAERAPDRDIGVPPTAIGHRVDLDPEASAIRLDQHEGIIGSSDPMLHAALGGAPGPRA